MVYFFIISSLPLTLAHNEAYSIQNSHTTENINDIYFIDENNGWMVGDNGYCSYTTNAGTDWIIIDLPNNNNYNAIVFIDSSIGFIGGDQSLFKTLNNGEDWINIAPQIEGNSANISAIRFFNQTHGYCSGSKLFQTIDGGLTWIVKHSSEIEHIISSNWNLVFVVIKNIDNEDWSLIGTENAGTTWDIWITLLHLSVLNPQSHN